MYSNLSFSYLFYLYIEVKASWATYIRDWVSINVGPPHTTLIWSPPGLEPATKQRFAYDAETKLTEPLSIMLLVSGYRVRLSRRGSHCCWFDT